MQNRIDLYASVHKALRARLFDLGVELDRCDFAKTLEVAVAMGAYRRTIAFVREHHELEDRFIEPALARGASDVFEAVQRQHAGADVSIAELDGLIAAIDLGATDRRSAGTGLCARYRQFLIEYLEHMRFEETVVNDSLWSQYSDAELADVRGRLQGSLPAARFAEWLEIMLPALNLDERTAMLRGIRAGAPPPVLSASTAIAARVLGSAGWEAVRERLDRD